MQMRQKLDECVAKGNQKVDAMRSELEAAQQCARRAVEEIAEKMDDAKRRKHARFFTADEARVFAERVSAFVVAQLVKVENGFAPTEEMQRRFVKANPDARFSDILLHKELKRQIAAVGLPVCAKQMKGQMGYAGLGFA